MAIFTFPRKIFYQRDIIDSLHDIIPNAGKVLIITDENILKIHGNRIGKALQGMEFRIISHVNPEPTIESIENTFKENRSFRPDTVIAIGGGSVIDFAKSIALKYSYPDKNLIDVNPFETLNLNVNLIAVPTTSGTGSDVSFGIVLSDGSRKVALGNYDLVPHISILDSSLTPSSRDIVRVTGIDAFVHAFEALSANTSTILTDALAEKAIETIYHNLKNAMDNIEEAKDYVHLSATMAGIAFSNSGTALAHALGHAFGATFHVVHGTSVGIFLPHVIKFNSRDPRTNDKYRRVAKILDENNILDAIKKFYALVNQAYYIKDIGIGKESFLSRIDEVTEKALMDSELAFNPVIAGEEDIKNLLMEAYGD